MTRGPGVFSWVCTVCEPEEGSPPELTPGTKKSTESRVAKIWVMTLRERCSMSRMIFKKRSLASR